MLSTFLKWVDTYFSLSQSWDTYCYSLYFIHSNIPEGHNPSKEWSQDSYPISRSINQTGTGSPCPLVVHKWRDTQGHGHLRTNLISWLYKEWTQNLCSLGKNNFGESPGLSRWPSLWVHNLSLQLEDPCGNSTWLFKNIYFNDFFFFREGGREKHQREKADQCFSTWLFEVHFYATSLSFGKFFLSICCTFAWEKIRDDWVSTFTKEQKLHHLEISEESGKTVLTNK